MGRLLPGLIKAGGKGEVIREVRYQGRRFVVSYRPARAMRQRRRERLKVAEAFIKRKLTRLRRKSGRGRRLTPEGAYNAIRDYLRQRRLLRLFRLELRGDRVVVQADRKARAWERKIDGILVVETTNKGLSAVEVIEQYKNLQDVEQGFRTLKSSLDLRPCLWQTGDVSLDSGSD